MKLTANNFQNLIKFCLQRAKLFRQLLSLNFSFYNLRIGNDRFKSKVIYETLCPRWLEQFDLNLSEDMVQELEVTVWDKDQGRKDDFMGRYQINLKYIVVSVLLF